MRVVEWGFTAGAFVFTGLTIALQKLHIISADRAYVWLHPEDWNTPVERPQAMPERRAHAAQKQSAA